MFVIPVYYSYILHVNPPEFFLSDSRFLEVMLIYALVVLVTIVVWAVLTVKAARDKKLPPKKLNKK